MTLTVNSDCTSISILSDNLSATNQTVNLFWSKNCSTTTSKISISTAASVVQLAPEDLDSADTFSDGVYYFKLVITQEDGTTVEESICRFVNCASSCLMLPVYKLTDSASILKQLAFEALLASTNCTSCTCADLCMFYTNTGLTTIANDDCGCN